MDLFLILQLSNLSPVKGIALANIWIHDYARAQMAYYRIANFVIGLDAGLKMWSKRRFTSNTFTFRIDGFCFCL